MPVTVPAGLAAFSLVAIIHLLIGKFDTTLVIPVGLIAALIAGYYAHRMSPIDSSHERKSFDILTLLAIVLWVIANIFFTSEHLFVNRDPAAYNTAAIWLTTHENLNIEKPTSEKMLDNPNISTESLAYATNPDKPNTLNAHGAHLLPTLQAVANTAFGIEGILRINILFGATALLAFYGFSRNVTKPRWAFLATTIMALSLPMIFMARDSYTEPLTMAFLFGGLTLLLYAQQSRKYWQWWLAGLVLGITALTRIDAYLAFIGIELVAIALLMVAAKKDRLRLAGCVMWLGLGMAIGGYLGWLDITLISQPYYLGHQPLIIRQFQLMVALAAAGVILVAISWRYNWLRWLNQITTKWRDKTIWAITGGFFVVLASRPLWFTGLSDHTNPLSPRTFSEQTINWIIWYVGPIIMIAGVIGLTIAITRILRGKNNLLMPFIAILSVSSLLYLLNPNITGDQVWATRRLLPVVIPGFVLLGMMAFGELYAKSKIKWRGRKYNVQVATIVLVTLSVVSPIFISYPFAINRLYAGELAQLQTVCDKLPDKTTVVWIGESRDFSTQSTRALCGNDSLGLALATDNNPEATKQQLIELHNKAQASGINIIVGFYATDIASIPTDATKESLTVSSLRFNEIEHTYIRFPRNLIDLERTIMMGKIQPDGTIAPVQ